MVSKQTLITLFFELQHEIKQRIEIFNKYLLQNLSELIMFKLTDSMCHRSFFVNFWRLLIHINSYINSFQKCNIKFVKEIKGKIKDNLSKIYIDYKLCIILSKLAVKIVSLFTILKRFVSVL